LKPAARILDQRARDALRRLEWQLRHRRVESALGGGHRSIFRGRGVEFDQVAKYAFGDDIRDVDWNVTARRGEPYRKTFVEEREITVIVVVNDDPALQFGYGATNKRDVLFEVAGLTLMLAAVNRERASLLYVSPLGTKFVAPTRRRERILEAVAELFAASVPDPASHSRFAFSPMLARPAPRGALIVWFGEVPAQPAPPAWAAIQRRHPVMGVRVEDEWERIGPMAESFMAYDPTVKDLVCLEASPAMRARHAAWRAERERIWLSWWPYPSERLVVDAGADPLTALTRFLRTRGRSLSLAANA
jgi:uncharacterized protein (DUF58 family)